MSDELPDPWGKPAYGGGASAPPPGTPPPRPPAPPTTAMPPTSGTPDPSSMPTSAIPVTRAGGGGEPPRGPIPPMGGDLPPPDGRRPLILGIAIGLVVALIVGLIAFALTRDDDGDESSESTEVPPATTLPPETVPEPTTTTVVIEETTTLPTTTTEATTTTAPQPTTTIADPSGWPSGFTLTVAASDGVRIVGPNGANTLVVQEPVEIALPVPGTNDFVIQSRSGRSGSSDETEIWRVGQGGAVLLIAPPAGVFLRLHDVRVVAGNPVVLYSADVGDNPENQSEVLAQYRLGDGSVVDLGQIGGWESGTSRLKLGGVTAVGEFYAEANRGLLSVREDGTTIDPTSIGLEESYFDCSDCPRLYTITPNGQRLAWLDGNSLVVVDLGTGAEVQRAGVPGDVAASVDDIALSDNIAVLNRVAADGSWGNAVIVDLGGAAPVFVDVPTPGFAAR